MDNLEDIKGIGDKVIKELNKLKIYNKNDLINFYPFRYDFIERSTEYIDNEKIIIDGKCESIPRVFYINKKQNKMSFTLNTGNSIINVIVWGRAFLKSKIGINTNLTIIGKYDQKHNTITASDIKFSLLDGLTIEPVYHSTYKISSNKINSLVNKVINNINPVDYVPNIYNEKYKLINKSEAIKIIHNPKNKIELKNALNKLKYEELFLFMLKMNSLKKHKKTDIGIKRSVDYNEIKKVINHLPFKLTKDQLKSIDDIYNDLTNEIRMNRLIQGDVGSGKTIVSFIAAYINYLSGYQTALMAPTDIIAKQHLNSFKKLFPDINSVLLTGKLKVSEKKEIYKQIKDNQAKIIIGTHALFSDKLEYNSLGLVITDEQHRFGVNQRGNLKNKGITPDTLYMSATPIPRTYALTLYGDMDITNIKTMPNGRKEIITSLKKNKDIKDVLNSMLTELKKNHQIYVIAPLIEESDKIDLENVTLLKEKMDRAFSKYYNVGLLHGKMSEKEKEKTMDDFKNNKINILVSTTVIEVGVDVPNATMMVIFDSFRFGLSALHQLRGRVGRNDLQSYCILISDKESKRLDILTKTNDGFKISEEDFILRGSGDLFGFKQSGDMVFKIADFRKDYNILLKAKEDSDNYLNTNDFKDNVALNSIISNSVNLD